jgi:tetratricopeptide (TPR) repeat protein
MLKKFWIGGLFSFCLSLVYVQAGISQTQEPPQKDIKKPEAITGDSEVKAKSKMAQDLFAAGKYKEAADQYIWLWNNIPKLDPPMIGVRDSYIVSQMKRLIRVCPELKPLFEQLRSDTEKKDRSDWIVLNDALNEPDKTLAWFDSVKNDPTQAEFIEHHDVLLERLLVSQHRWADMGKYLYKDPMKKLQKQYEFSKNLKEFYKTSAAATQMKHPPRDLFPKSVGVLYVSLLAAGREEDARKVAEESFRLDDSKELRASLAVQANSIGQTRPEQLKWIADLKPETPTDAVFYLGRAIVYGQLGKPDLELNDLNKAIELKPNDIIYRERAQLLINQKKYKEAIQDFDRLVEKRPSDVPLIVCRGYVYYNMRNYKSALVDFDRAATINPKDPLIWVNKSAVFLKEKEYAEAYKSASQALELDPKNFGASCNRGEASFKLEHYSDALPDLTNAIDCDSKSARAEAMYYRALVYEKTGKADLAAADRKSIEQLGGYKPESDD